MASCSSPHHAPGSAWHGSGRETHDAHAAEAEAPVKPIVPTPHHHPKAGTHLQQGFLHTPKNAEGELVPECVIETSPAYTPPEQRTPSPRSKTLHRTPWMEKTNREYWRRQMRLAEAHGRTDDTSAARGTCGARRREASHGNSRADPDGRRHGRSLNDGVFQMVDSHDTVQWLHRVASENFEAMREDSRGQEGG